MSSAVLITYLVPPAILFIPLYAQIRNLGLADSLAGLEPALASRLGQALALDEHPLRIVVQDERSLSRNQEIAVERLRKLVTEALSPPPPRRPTRPSRGSRERRLAAKARRGQSKELRRPPDDE